MRTRTCSDGSHESKRMTLKTWQGSGRVLIAVMWMILLRGAAASPISLTLNPTNIQNDYVGNVTLRIGNLNPGMTVRVEAFADLNTNGVIDAGDELLKSFEVTDGRVPLVAGMRNLNVPGDEDGLTNGAI